MKSVLSPLSSPGHVSYTRLAHSETEMQLKHVSLDICPSSTFPCIPFPTLQKWGFCLKLTNTKEPENVNGLHSLGARTGQSTGRVNPQASKLPDWFHKHGTQVRQPWGRRVVSRWGIEGGPHHSVKNYLSLGAESKGLDPVLRVLRCANFCKISQIYFLYKDRTCGLGPKSLCRCPESESPQVGGS